MVNKKVYGVYMDYYSCWIELFTVCQHYVWRTQLMVFDAFRRQDIPLNNFWQSISVNWKVFQLTVSWSWVRKTFHTTILRGSPLTLTSLQTWTLYIPSSNAYQKLCFLSNFCCWHCAFSDKLPEKIVSLPPVQCQLMLSTPDHQQNCFTTVRVSP